MRTPVACGFLLFALVGVACMPPMDATLDADADAAAADAGKPNKRTEPGPREEDDPIHIDDGGVATDTGVGADADIDSDGLETNDAGTSTSIPDSGLDAAIACSDGYTQCGSRCEKLSTSLSNCGACGTVCVTPTNATANCNAGTCSYACNIGYIDDGAGGCAALPPSKTIDIAESDYDLCGLRADGLVWCGSDGQFVEGVSNAVSIGGGPFGMFIVFANGSFVGLGSGHKPGWSDTTITDITNKGKKVVEIAVGLRHACARTTDGLVYCWSSGKNAEEAAAGARSTPQPVSGVANVAKITAGQYRSCAIHTNGSMTCWGFGFGTWAVPVFTDAVDAALGGGHVCVILTGQRIACWGYNQTGQLGDGSGLDTSGKTLTPLGITSGVTSIAATYYRTCAAVSGAVKCWGAGAFTPSTPKSAAGIATAIKITMGGHALLADGSVVTY